MDTQSIHCKTKIQIEEEKCAARSGKYNGLIHTQARELTQLRQRIRESEEVSHILTYQLKNTTKAFERILRNNNIDDFMAQSFREQLAQSAALAHRVVTKTSGRESSESHDEKRHKSVLSVMWLTKELQEKDKVIMSLHMKLQQRAETSNLDRTCLVSDRFTTTEDLKLCSDEESIEHQEEERPLDPEPGQGPESVHLQENQADTGIDGGVQKNVSTQNLNTVNQLSEEIQTLKRENVDLWHRLQAISVTSKAVIQELEDTLAAQARLQQSKLEDTRRLQAHRKELRRLEALNHDQEHQIHMLKQERQTIQEKSNQLQQEASLLEQQLRVSKDLVYSLQKDLHIYHRGCSGTKASKINSLDPHSELEGVAPDGSYANLNGRHIIGHTNDFCALQQQVLEGQSLIQQIESILQARLGPLPDASQEKSNELILDSACVKGLLSNTTTMTKILQEAMFLLKMLWRVALPSTDPSVQNPKKHHCEAEFTKRLTVHLLIGNVTWDSIVMRQSRGSRMNHTCAGVMNQTLPSSHTGWRFFPLAGLVGASF